jgi:hypothetical protein
VDAQQHDPGSTLHGLPGQDGEDAPAAASTPHLAGASNLSPAAAPGLEGDLNVALADLMHKWGKNWGCRRELGMWFADGRTIDPDTGSVTPTGVTLAASSAEGLDAELAAWKGAR